MRSARPRHAIDAIERRGVAAVLLAAFAIATGLRAWHVAGDPLWLDEAYSAYAADHGFVFLWRVVPAYETHPPVYYSLVRLWSLLTGETLLARRMLGLIGGIAAVPIVASSARELGRLLDWSAARTRWLAALAAMLAATQPHMVLMARQLRPYPVMVPVYALGLWAALRLGRDARDGRRLHRGWLAGFAIAEAALMWLHTLGPLFGAALALALLATTGGRRLARGDWLALAATQFVAGLLYLPAFAIMLGQAPTWIGSTWLRFLPAQVPIQLAYLYVDWYRWTAMLAMLAAASAIVLLVAAGATGARAAVALVVTAALPTVATLILSATISPVFLTRTLSAVTMPGLILIATGLTLPGWWRVAVLPVAGWIIVTATAISFRLVQQPPMQDWYGVLDYLKPRMRAGDVVWAYPNEGALPLGYAMRDRGRGFALRPIPAAVPAFGMGYYPTGSRGVVSLYPRQIAALMRTPAATEPPTIWVLRLGAWRYDPGDRLVLALLRDRRIVGHLRQRQIDLLGLRRRDIAR